jgi:hypothetical protein
MRYTRSHGYWLALLLAAPIWSQDGGERDPAGLTREEKRLLLAQVIDQRRPLDERAILEHEPYLYLLKLCSKLKEDDVKDEAEDEPPYARLDASPSDESLRGRRFTLKRCVIIEAAQVDLPPAWGLPGYRVVQAVAVRNGPEGHELWELRLLVKPGSDFFKDWKKYYADGRSPIYRISGFFFKTHARRTSADEVWQAPLVVAPEPKRLKVKESYPWKKEVEEANLEQHLPSWPIRSVPSARQRLVVEVLADARGKLLLRSGGQQGTYLDRAFLERALLDFKATLPKEEQPFPSAVVLRHAGVAAQDAYQVALALEDAGLQRVYLKNGEFLDLALAAESDRE